MRCKCGVCGKEIWLRPEDIEDEGGYEFTSSEWICDDCILIIHPEYLDFGEY